MEIARETRPLSASQLEAYDSCPAAYRYTYVDRLPAPEADQRQRLLGSALHAVVERYVRHCVATRSPQDLEALERLPQELYKSGAVRHATASLYREALGILRPFLQRWQVPWDRVVGVEHRFALTADGGMTDWRSPDAAIRGVLDLVTVDGSLATVWDWKSGWVEEDEAAMALAWAPAIYGAAMWAWAHGLERVEVEYWYVRSGRIRRVEITREAAREGLAWVRAAAERIAAALADPNPDEAWPARPGRACATCPWVARCQAGREAANIAEVPPVTTESEARRLAGLLLAAEARTARLRQALQDWLREREPLALDDDLALGWWPTRGSLPAGPTLRLLRDAGLPEESICEALRVDNYAVARLARRWPDLAAALEALRQPTPPWWGHRKPQRTNHV